MTFTNSKYVRLKNTFSGGQIDNVPDFMLEDKDSPYLINARVDGRGTKIRPGFSNFVNLTGTGNIPNGITPYYRSNGTNNLIVGFTNDNTHKLISIDINSGVQIPILTNGLITNPTRTNFLNVGDNLYCFNGVDLLGKLNNTTYTNPTTGVSGLAPAFGVYMNNSLFVSGWGANPNKVYMSTALNNDDFSGAGSNITSFPYIITGLATNLQAVYYFSKNNIDVTSAGDINSTTVINRPLQTKEGSVNHNGIVVAGDFIYFITPSNKIMRIGRNSIGNYLTEDVSHRAYKGISETMATLDKDQANCFGYYIPDKNIIKWYFKSRNSTFNNICIVYNTQYDLFSIDDNVSFFGGTNINQDNFVISNLTKKIYKDEYGHSDDDTPIYFERKSKIYTFGEPTLKKELYQTRLYASINQLTELKQQILIDGNIINTTVYNKNNIPISTGGIGTDIIGTQTVGTDVLNQTQYTISKVIDKSKLMIRGNEIQVIWSCGSLGADFTLLDFDMRLQLKDQKLANN